MSTDKSNAKNSHLLLLMHPQSVTEEFIQGLDSVQVFNHTGEIHKIKLSISRNDITIVKVYHNERLPTFLIERHNLAVFPSPKLFDGDPVTQSQLKQFISDDRLIKYMIPDKKEFDIGTFKLIKFSIM